MSLIISLVQKGSISIDTDLLEEQIPEPYNKSFGFETCRETLWGINCIRELGCEMIYSLKNKDIIVFDEEIEKLKGELHNLLENIEIVKLHTSYDKEFIEFRIRNALEMIEIALKDIDTLGIAIW